MIAAVFKTLVTRFVVAFKELKSNENIALYCDVRQLITYVKGAHGGPFRRAALSGIMAVTPRPNKKSPNLQTTRVIRHLQPGETQFFQSDEKNSRKILFKKRSTSSACPVSCLYGVLQDANTNYRLHFTESPGNRERGGGCPPKSDE